MELGYLGKYSSQDLHVLSKVTAVMTKKFRHYHIPVFVYMYANTCVYLDGCFFVFLSVKVIHFVMLNRFHLLGAHESCNILVTWLLLFQDIEEIISNFVLPKLKPIPQSHFWHNQKSKFARLTFGYKKVKFCNCIINILKVQHPDLKY